MPSNYTSNYHLNQWAKSDQVKMEDFNADNAKIDAAIKAVNARIDAALAELRAETARLKNSILWERMAEVRTTQAQKQIDLDLSGFDLSKFQELILDSKIQTGTHAYASVAFYRKDGTEITSRGVVCSTNSRSFTRLVLLCHDDAVFILNSQGNWSSQTFYSEYSQSSGTCMSVAPKELALIRFSLNSSDDILAGARFILHGMRR